MHLLTGNSARRSLDSQPAAGDPECLGRRPANIPAQKRRNDDPQNLKEQVQEWSCEHSRLLSCSVVELFPFLGKNSWITRA